MSDLLEKIASAFELYQLRAEQYLIGEPPHVFCAQAKLTDLAKDAVSEIRGGRVESHELILKLLPDMKTRDGTGMFLTELLAKLDQPVLRIPERVEGEGVPFLRSLGYSLRKDQVVIVGKGIHIGDLGGNDCQGLLIGFGNSMTMGKGATCGTYVNAGEVTFFGFGASGGMFVNVNTCQIQGLMSIGGTYVNLGQTYSLKPENSHVINYGRTALGSCVIRGPHSEEHKTIIRNLRCTLEELKMCSSDEQTIPLIDRVTRAITELSSKE